MSLRGSMLKQYRVVRIFAIPIEIAAPSSYIGRFSMAAICWVTALNLRFEGENRVLRVPSCLLFHSFALPATVEHCCCAAEVESPTLYYRHYWRKLYIEMEGRVMLEIRRTMKC